MNAKRMMMAGMAMMGMMWANTPKAVAGPYPLEQLMAWLHDAEAKLATVDAEIAEIKAKLAEAKEKLVKAENLVSNTDKPGPELIKKVKDARENVNRLMNELARANEIRTEIVNYIAGLRLQIAAWDEIKGNGGAN